MIGVIIGAVGSYLVATTSDRARWRRERSSRWDVSRMQTYAVYGRAVKRITDLAVRVAAHRGVGEFVATLPLAEGLPRLADADAERAALWEQVLLLGDPATVAAARRWHETAWHLDQLVRGEHPDQDAWSLAMNRANDARAAFYAAARADLGVSGDVPSTRWPRRPERPR
jgi:hypothetical protein